MQQNERKAWQTRTFLSLPLAALWVLAACERQVEEKPQPAEPAEAVQQTCGSDGFLSAQLYGSIERKIDWASAVLHCESMLRPDNEGVRLRFTGNAADSKLAIILALPQLERGMTLKESSTVVTLTVEGSGRFFSTPNLESCWTDVEFQNLISGDRYTIGGTLYCVAPLGEINGDAAINIPQLAFHSIVDWSAK